MTPQDTSGFHLDSEIRVNNQRHAGIVIKEGKILLMERKKNGFEFWTIPGGHLQKGEDPLKVVLREVEEETIIKVKNPTLVFEFRDYYKNNFDYYYLCEYIEGVPTLGGEEAEKSNELNYYNPQWVELEKVFELNLLPKFAKEWIVENLIERETN